MQNLGNLSYVEAGLHLTLNIGSPWSRLIVSLLASVEFRQILARLSLI